MCERSSLRCFRFHGFYPASGLESSEALRGGGNAKEMTIRRQKTMTEGNSAIWYVPFNLFHSVSNLQLQAVIFVFCKEDASREGRD